MKDTESKKSEGHLKNTKSDADVKDQQMKVLQETIRNLQTQLMDNKTKERENLTKIHNLELKLKRANAKELMQKPKTTDDSVTSLSDQASDSSDSDKDVVCVDDDIDTTAENDLSQIDRNFTEIDVDEARLIALMSAFLVVYPFGASLDNITKYIQQVTICDKDIETILRKYSNIFNEIPASDASLEIKWKFCGFETNLLNNIVDCD